MIVYFILACILSLLIMPLAFKLNIIDKPNYRKIHTNPIPKGGGISIIIPIILIGLYKYSDFAKYSEGSFFSSKYLAFFMIVMIFMIIGIIDDKIELHSKTKLFLQIILASITIIAGIQFEGFNFQYINMLVTFFWIIGIVNAVNLIDGLDGLAAGISLISNIGFFMIGYMLKNNAILFLSSIVIGSCLGFLKYNFHPAKIFMGDTGSLPLGYILAVLGIFVSNQIKGFTSIIPSAVILAVPIFDTLLSIIRRKINNKPILQPDRSHFYNLLMDQRNFSHRDTVITIYIINIILVFISALTAILSNMGRIILLALLIVISLICIRKMRFIRIDEGQENCLGKPKGGNV